MVDYPVLRPRGKGPRTETLTLSLTESNTILVRVPDLRRAAVTLVGVVAVAVAMVVRGHVPDPLTAVLTLLVVAGAASLRGAGLGRRGLGLHDEVDRETGVGNARGALSLIERETTRAGNYGSLFSIAVVDVSRTVFDGVPRRRGTRILRELLQGVADDVRTDDRVCRVATSDRELLVVVLPDTGAGGAGQFTDRLVAHTQQHFSAHALPVEGSLRAEIMTQPDDHDDVRRFSRRLEVLLGAEDLIHHGVRVRSRPRGVAHETASAGSGQREHAASPSQGRG